MKKVKVTMGQQDDTTRSGGAVAVRVHPSVSVSSCQVEVLGSPVALSRAVSTSRSQVSDVPTAFGGELSMVSKDGGATTSAKPGNKSQKSWQGF